MSTADQLKEIAATASRELHHLEFLSAHLEGRIRFYLQVLNGEWQYNVDLIAVIKDDLRRLEESRKPLGQPTKGAEQ